MTDDSAAQAILAQERRALEQWSQGGILTMRYAGSLPDGQPIPTWKATSVYRRAGGEWRIVHAHWSMVKDA